MGSFVDGLIAGISKGDDEAILAACETADAFHLRGFKPFPPYDQLLAAEPPSADDVERLKSALVAYVQSTASPGTRAYVALGKCRDPALVPLLRKQLAQELKTMLLHNGAVSGLIIALDNTGEKIIGGNSHSPMEMDKNVADARAYLKKFGQVIPW